MEPPVRSACVLGARGRALAALLVLGPCACSGSGDGAPPAALAPPSAPPRRCVLEPLAPAAAPERVLVPAATGQPWRARSGTLELGPGGVLLARGGPEVELEVALAFRPELFEGLRLALESAGALTLAVRTEPSGEQGAALELPAAGGRREVLLELPRADERAEGLVLVLGGDLGSGASVLAAGLPWAPPEALRRRLAGGAELRPTLLGEEWRPAAALATRRGLACELVIEGDGERLELGVGIAPEARGAPRGLRLRVDLLPEDSPPRTTRVAIEAVDRWQRVSIPLDEAPGTRARVELRLEHERRGEVYGFVDAPLVVRGGPDAPAPFVLLVTSDTHRGDHLGAAANPAGVSTPVLDALAARGVLFEDCFSTSHITVPSHAALFTGESPRETGVTENHTVLAEEARTLADVFREAGYVTWAATSLNVRHTGIGQGFDRLAVPRRQRSADATLERMLPWLEESGGLPVFLWLHLFDAHAPYRPPEEHWSRHYPRGRDPFDPRLEPDLVPPAWLAEARDAEYVRALYRGEVSYLDQRLARVFEHPRVRAGVLAFTADHGEGLGEQGVWWTHNGLMPRMLHVPLILAWPGAPAGRRVAGPVQLTGVGRTLLDLAGLERAAFGGRNLFAALAAGDLERTPRFALSAGRESASITLGAWHGVLHLRDFERDYVVTRARHAFELYDLGADPGCREDLADAGLETARELRGRLVLWLRGYDGGRWGGGPVGDPATLENLARLGYADASGDVEGGADELFPADCACAACEAYR